MSTKNVQLIEGPDGIYDITNFKDGPDLIAHAIKLASENDTEITFRWSNAIVTVAADSQLRLIHRDVVRAMHESIGPEIGPYPAEQLSLEELQAHKANMNEKDSRWREEKAASDNDRDIRRQEAQQAAAETPPIEVIDQQAWLGTFEEATDGYERSALVFAEVWARLAQAELANKPYLELVDIITSSALEAGILDLPNALRMKIIRILAVHWIHGRQLLNYYGFGAKQLQAA